MFRCLKSAIVLAVAISSTTLSAQYGGPTCQQSDPCCCGATVGAEWLYLRPYASHTVYARTMDIFAPPPAPSQDIARNDLKAVCPTYDSGVRLWLGYINPCSAWGLGGSYTYFSSADTDTTQLNLLGLIAGTSERFLVNPQGLYADSAGAASPRNYQFLRAIGTVDFNYQAANFQVSGMLPMCCPFSLSFEAGLSWAQVDNVLRTKYSQPAPNPASPVRMVVANSTYFSGVGPRIGFDAEWQVPCLSCLTLHANAATSLLVSQIRGSIFQRILDDEAGTVHDLDYKERFPNCDRLIPALEAKIDARLSYACGCYALSVEIGFKADHYINALFTHRLTGSTHPSVNVGGTEERMETTKGFVDLGDVSFGGLYLGADVSF